MRRSRRWKKGTMVLSPESALLIIRHYCGTSTDRRRSPLSAPNNIHGLPSLSARCCPKEAYITSRSRERAFMCDFLHLSSAL